MLRLSVILVCLLPALIFGQDDKGKYKFNYRFVLKDTSSLSSYSIQAVDTAAGGTSLLGINTSYFPSEPIAGAQIRLTSPGFDTTLVSGMDGKATCLLPPGLYGVGVSYAGTNSLTIKAISIKPDTRTLLHAYLSQPRSTEIVHIHSIRRLKKAEIKQLIDDRLHRRESQLVKDKVCIFSFEI